MNTIKAGVKALHLDTGETVVFATVRETAEYMARYRISEQKIRQVLSRGKTGLDHVRGWTFAYVGEPFKVTDSSGRVRNRERRVWYRVKIVDPDGEVYYDYPFKTLPDGTWYNGLSLTEALDFINGYGKVRPKLRLEDIVRLADTGGQVAIGWGDPMSDPTTYAQVSWVE